MPDQNYDTAPLLNDAQMDLLNSMANKLSKQIGKGVPAYGGTVVPDTPEGLQAAIDASYGAVSGPEAQARRAALQRALSADTSVRAEDYVQGFNENVYRPSLDLYERGERRQLAHQYGSGGGGGPLQSILADSRALFDAAMLGRRSDMYTQGLQAEEGARQLSLSAVPISVANQQGGIATAIGGGQLERSFEGQRLGEGYSKWQMQQPWANPWLSQYYAASMGNTITPVGKPSTLDRVMSGVGGLMSMAG